MALFLCVLFNLKFSRDWARKIVGQNYYENYMSHSLVAWKSVIPSVLGIGGITAAEKSTARQYYAQHVEVVESMRKKIDTLRKEGLFDSAQGMEVSLCAIQEKFKYDGIVAKAFQEKAFQFRWPGGAPDTSEDTKKILFDKDV